MRNPNSINQIFEPSIDDNRGIIKIENIPDYDIQDWDLKSPDNEFTKYITYLERIVRGSLEYKAFVNYLKNAFDMNACSFYRNVNNINSNGIKIHIHHEPITLYDICQIVIRKRQAMDESLDEEDVAKEVMWLHYNGYVGLIPLSETVHELVHNNYLFIPSNYVFGDYKAFIQLYNQFFTIEQLDTIKEIEEASLTYSSDEYKKLLKTSFSYVDDTGAYDIPSVEEIRQLLINRKAELRNQQFK